MIVQILTENGPYLIENWVADFVAGLEDIVYVVACRFAENYHKNFALGKSFFVATICP